MATVTGLTAARMLEIEAASVVDGSVVGDNLILTKHDNTTIDAGNVRGPQANEGFASGENAPIVTLGAGPVTDLTQQYQISGGVLPANWPVDVYGDKRVTGGLSFVVVTSQVSTGTVSTYRMMCDGDEMALFTLASTFWADVYVDGKPLSNNPLQLLPTAGTGAYGITRLKFPTAKTRLIEWRSLSGMNGVFTKKPYRIWKPPISSVPSVAVIGDSYVAPTTLKDDAPGAVSGGYYLRGLYQRMAALLGTSRMTSDGIGGTGYIAPGGAVMPYSHATRIAWRNLVNPDVLVIHGGGANDLYQGNTVAATITAATNYFTQARTDLPNAKLVFVEGFSPPLFTPATYNPNYKSIREGVQANLASASIEAYFLSVASDVDPALMGSGYVTAPNGTGNSDIYVGADGVHLSARGNEYCRNWLAPKIKRVMNDDGSLAGTLI